jgi:hypothetical protein
MGYSIFQHDLFWRVFGLLTGLSVVIVVLGEISERLEQRGNSLAQGVRYVRYLVVPLLAVLLIVRYILAIAAEEPWVRGFETLLWITVMYAGLTLIRNLIQNGENQAENWVHKVPGLILQSRHGGGGGLDGDCLCLARYPQQPGVRLLAAGRSPFSGG